MSLVFDFLEFAVESVDAVSGSTSLLDNGLSSCPSGKDIHSVAKRMTPFSRLYSVRKYTPPTSRGRIAFSGPPNPQKTWLVLQTLQSTLRRFAYFKTRPSKGWLNTWTARPISNLLHKMHHIFIALPTSCGIYSYSWAWKKLFRKKHPFLNHHFVKGWRLVEISNLSTHWDPTNPKPKLHSTGNLVHLQPNPQNLPLVFTV